MPALETLSGSDLAVWNDAIDKWATYRGVGKVAFDASFAWDLERYPVNVYRRGFGSYYTNLDPRSLVSSDIWNGQVVYVDGVAGTVGNSGSTYKTPTNAIWRARQTIEAGGSAGGIIMVRGYAGFIYDRTLDFNNTSNSATTPTKPIAIVGWGEAQPEWGPVALLTYTLDSTAYISARANVFRVLDRLNRDEGGSYREIPRLASAAAVNASTTGGWVQDGTNVRIKRADGLAVSDANTIVLLSGAACNPGTVDLYLSNVSILGGQTATLRATLAGTYNIVAEDCQFSYGGAYGDDRRVVSLDNMDGIGAFFRCKVHKANTDLFNVHGANGSLTHLLTVDCEGWWSGLNSTVVSGNHWTLHEACRGIDIGGRYNYGGGGLMACIDQTSSCMFGTVLNGDRGDTQLPSHAARVEGSAKAWLYECRSQGNINSFRTHNSTDAALYAIGCRDGGGLRVGNVL